VRFSSLYDLLGKAACPHYQQAAVFILPGRRTRERLLVKIAHQQHQSYLPNALTVTSIIINTLKIAGTFQFFQTIHLFVIIRQ